MIIAGIVCLLFGYFLGPDSLYVLGAIVLVLGLALRIAEATYLSSGGRAHYCQCDPRQAVTDVVGTRLGTRSQCAHAGPGCPRSIRTRITQITEVSGLEQLGKDARAVEVQGAE